MSRSRSTEKSWQNAYLTEQRQPSGHVGAGRFTSGYINPADRAAERNRQAVARNQAMQHHAQGHGHSAGAGAMTASGIGADPEDQHLAAEAKALQAQAANLEQEIDRLNGQLKNAKGNLAAAQQAGAAGAAAGAATGAAASNTGAAAAQGAAGAAAGAATGAATSNTAAVTQAQSQVSGIKQQIRQLKKQRSQLLRRARDLLRDARKGATSTITKGHRVASVLTPQATKAATLTGDGELTYASFPITKFEETPDGDLTVSGTASDGSVDSDRQIIDPEWAQKGPGGFPDWFDSAGNVRVQHQSQRDPAGKGLKVEFSGDRTIVRSLVVEPIAKELVRKGVLTAYSVGIANPIIERDPTGRAPGGIIKGGQIVELSLVDRPANKNCGFQLVKAAKDGSPEWVGKVFGDTGVLTKAARPVKAVNVDLPANMSLSVKPSDLAKLQTLGRRLAMQENALKAAAEPVAVKRDIDTATRRRLASEGKALPDGSYPIENTGDLQNAAVLARSGHGDVKAAKRLIARRAKELGVPNPLKAKKAEKAAGADAKVTRDVAAAESATQRAEAAQATDPDRKSDPADRKVSRRLKRSQRALRATARAQAKDNASDAKQHAKAKKKAMKAAAPDMVKCSSCGGSGMTGGKPCGECKRGRKMTRRMAKKTAAAAVTKKHKVMCGSCGAMQNAKHGHCSECGAAMAGAMPVTKNHDFRCLGCGGELDKGEKHCPGCGKDNPGYNPMADLKIPANKAAKRTTKQTASRKAGKGRVNKGKKKSGKKKTGSATPGDGVVGEHMKPAPAHHEPGGSVMEMPAHKNADSEVAAALRLRALAVPPHLGALHAATCPAYDPADVAKAFPHFSFADVDASEWQGTTLTKAASAPIAEVAAAMALGGHALTLKTADPHLLTDIAAGAHKMFRDANPGPSHFPTPGELSPERFRRPLITEGHEAPSPGHDAPHHMKLPPMGGIMAQDFHRGYISEGHAADSPENHGRAEPMPAPGHTGSPTSGPARQFYTHAAREGARHAMEAMHDHIAATFPDLCPMHGAEDIARHPVPTPEGVPDVKPAPGKKGGKGMKKAAAAKARKHTRPARNARRGPRKPPAPALDAAALKTAMAEANAPLLERIAAQDAALKAAGKTLRKQAKAIDAMAGQPDTRNAPHRSVTLTKSSAPAAQAPTASGLAEQAQLAKMQMLHRESLLNPSPERREAARAEYMAMLGVSSMNPQTTYTYPYPPGT